jgi:hypothetical protein
MKETLTIIGVACIAGAIVGGGLTVAKMVDVPVIKSFARQVLLGLFGVILVVVGLLLPASSPNPGPPTPSPALSTGGFTIPSIPQPPTEETRISLSPGSGPPGTQILVSGAGFEANESVDIRLADGSVQETKADDRGRFSNVPIQIPSGWPFTGPFHIVAEGKSSLMFDDAEFTVT